MMKIFVLLFIISFPLYSQTKTYVGEPLDTSKKPIKEKVLEVVEEAAQTSAYFRQDAHHSLMLGYQVLTTWIPFKWTAAYTYSFNSQWSLEGEFSRGHFGIGKFGFDAASINEQRYSLIARRYIGNSFHFILGGFKNDFHAQVGSGITSDIINSHVNDFRVQSFGVALGIGNRWQWGSGFTLGIDWFRMNMPLLGKKVDSEILDKIDDKNDLSEVKRWINRVKNVPTFVLLGVNLGYSF